MLKKVVCIFFSIILITSVYADDFDDLFADPEEDIVAEVEVETSVLDKVDETGTVKVTGSFGETLGWSGGLINVLDGFSKNNIKAIFGLDANASVSIEARPHTSFRMYGTLSAKTNEANIADPWNIIDISTLAIEYNIKKTAFFTVGKFATSLGTDFISISDGTSFKISFPTVLSGLNLLVNVDSNTIVNGTVIPQRLYFATWGDAVFGPTRLSLGFRYQGKDDKIHQERFGSYFGLTSSFYGLNFSTELAYYAYPQHSLSGNLLAYYMFNQFYIGMNYTIDAYVTGYDYLNQNIQLGFR